MAAKSDFSIVVLPGDGIGVEVMDACLALLEPVQRKVGGFRLAYEPHPGGAGAYRDTGVAFSDAAMKACERADAILFGAMGLPDVRYPDGTEIAPQLDLRNAPRALRRRAADPGDPRRAAAARRSARARTSTSCWCASRPRAGSTAGTTRRRRRRRPTTRPTTSAASPRKASERLFEFSFRLAERRKRAQPEEGPRHLRRQGERASRHGALPQGVLGGARSAIRSSPADALRTSTRSALNLIRKPWDYDVAADREPVRRHPLRPRRGADRRDGAGALGRHRRRARALPACRRHRARHRGQGHREPDRDVPLGGDDARVARRPARRAEGARGRPSASSARSTPRSRAEA